MSIRKIRKFLDNNQITDRQTDREQFNNLGHSNPLWIVGGAGQFADKQTENKEQTDKQRTVQKLRPL